MPPLVTAVVCWGWKLEAVEIRNSQEIPRMRSQILRREARENDVFMYEVIEFGTTLYRGE